MSERPADPVARSVAITAVCGAAAVGLTAGLGVLAFEGDRLPGFLQSLGLVGAILVPLAVVVTWLHARSSLRDVEYVARGVDDMLRDEAWGHPVPLPSRDEVGELTRRVEALRRHYVGSLDREREARREAERADRDKTEFLDSVSHELKNPLNAIVGFSDVLLEEIDGPLEPAQREDLSIIRSAGAHLVALFNDVLDLSAAVSGHLRIERRPVDLGPILHAVGGELRGLRRDRPVEVIVRVASDLPPVVGDARRLRQVVTNLASNALKFTERGEVRLEADREGEWVAVRVIDTGSGIAEDEVPRLFAEFGQVGEGKNRAQGTGLGLAISKQLTVLHGGRIEVDSALGQGSTFTVWLPVGEEAAA